MTEGSTKIEQAAALWRGSRRVVALTGAGISTGSGIPDFRGPHAGLWESADVEAVASLDAFRHAPEKFFAWVRPLAGQIRRAEPNAAHRALAALEMNGKLRTLITQNIDELHRRAGSQHLLELHGSLHTATCGRCRRAWPGEPLLERFMADGQMPLCSCGGLLKPDVTLMGEQLDAATVRAAQSEARDCDLLLVAGSSLAVMPAAGLPVAALNHGARLVIVNQEPTYIDERATVVIRADVVEVLPALAAAVTGSVEVNDGPR
jgi:NAD-dependent deacetylase